MTTIVCMNFGNYCGRGVEYVNKLASMCHRHAPRHDFVCFTDQAEPGYTRGINVVPVQTNLHGWWAKLALFRPGLFEGDVLYLDLDVVISDHIGGLFDLLREHPGLWALDDWEYPIRQPRHPSTYPDGVDEAWILERVGGRSTCNSSVMLWRDDAACKVWETLTPEAVEHLWGDQNWITQCLGAQLQLIPSGWAASYKAGGTGAILVFHGDPKPHEITGPWMQRHWR